MEYETSWFDDITNFFTAIAFSLSRKKLLKKVGVDILGPEFPNYAILDMKDVSDGPISGFAANQIAGLTFGSLWSLYNLFAALRAYRQLKKRGRYPYKMYI